MRVRDWMTPHPITVLDTTPVSEARAIMAKHGIRGLPVKSMGGELIGVVTDRDLRETKTHLSRMVGLSAEAAKVIENCEVGLLMQSVPILVNIDDPLERAAEEMYLRKFHGCPVVEDSGELVGIITETDCLRALVRLLRGSSTSIDAADAADAGGKPDGD
jgi:acetoin utilization protein AcuB